MNAKLRQTTKSLIPFINNSPTAWHAAANVKSQLLAHGFQELEESKSWNLKKGGRYFVLRNGSTLCAFILPTGAPESGLILGSHTDSPSFKLRPNAEFRKENMVMLGVEIYGGPLLSSWLNRDLGIAGRVVYTSRQGNVLEGLVKLDQNPVVIPQLAIHLDRTVNDTGLILNKQDHLSALAAIDDDKNSSYLERLLKEQIAFKDILSHDLFLYPLEPARAIGNNGRLIAGYRIDSLSSVHAIAQALCDTESVSKNILRIGVLWDNEEVGSGTAQGAESPFLAQTIERILIALKANREDYFRLISQTTCVSVDLGHALHPNYAEKHDPRHQPLLNKGIVLKSNAQQRYATDAKSAALIVETCTKLKLPLQKFTSRGDIPSGTTIGPIAASKNGLSTVDIGIPQLSMHSCRELIGSEDHADLCRLLAALWG